MKIYIFITQSHYLWKSLSLHPQVHSFFSHLFPTKPLKWCQSMKLAHSGSWELTVISLKKFFTDILLKCYLLFCLIRVIVLQFYKKSMLEEKWHKFSHSVYVKEEYVDSFSFCDRSEVMRDWAICNYCLTTWNYHLKSIHLKKNQRKSVCRLV